MRAAVTAVIIVIIVIGGVAGPATADAQRIAPRPPGDCVTHAAQASRRSGLSVNVVLHVMHVESRGNPRALSRKGAMGCMQIMPATWAYLTRRYRLGSDPFDPRMNMIGGAHYLAELVTRFGVSGAYAAYNAGPGRYQRYLAHGVPLPAETVAYTARLDGSRPERRNAMAEPRWQEASLFIERTVSPAPLVFPASTEEEVAAPPRTAIEHLSGGLFPLAAAVTPPAARAAAPALAPEGRD